MKVALHGATGRMGLTRNLEAWEIVEQVRLIRRDLDASAERAGGGARVHGVLFQGMGEPLANADRVIQAIRVLSEPSAQAIDMRNITVCTAGLPSGIRRLAAEVPGVRLGLEVVDDRVLRPVDGVSHDVGDAAHRGQDGGRERQHEGRAGLEPALGRGRGEEHQPGDQAHQVVQPVAAAEQHHHELPGQQGQRRPAQVADAVRRGTAEPHDQADRDWALQTWRSVRHRPPAA